LTVTESTTSPTRTIHETHSFGNRFCDRGFCRVDASPGRPATGHRQELHGLPAIDKKLVGPSYKDVAAKYAGQKDAADKLAAKIIKGGSGVWGPVPMPANAQVNPEEAKKLATWVLATK